jgi:hypothetical protein
VVFGDENGRALRLAGAGSSEIHEAIPARVPTGSARSGEVPGGPRPRLLLTQAQRN